MATILHMHTAHANRMPAPRNRPLAQPLDEIARANPAECSDFRWDDGTDELDGLIADWLPNALRWFAFAVIVFAAAVWFTPDLVRWLA